MAENPLRTDETHVWTLTGRPGEFEYRTDNTLLDHLPDSDRWQNPDYYRTSNSIDDCENFSGASAFFLEAKGIPVEMIVKRLSRQQVSFPRQWIAVRSSTKGK